jgi:hypothetical protein
MLGRLHKRAVCIYFRLAWITGETAIVVVPRRNRQKQCLPLTESFQLFLPFRGFSLFVRIAAIRRYIYCMVFLYVPPLHIELLSR